MRQMIVALICLLAAWNTLAQPTDNAWIGDMTGGDFSDSTKWTLSKVPGTNDIAHFTTQTSNAGPVTCKNPQNVYGLYCEMPTGTTPPGSITISNNFTAYDIQMSDGVITLDKNSHLMLHNSSATFVVSGTAKVDIFGWVDFEISITSTSATVTVEAGASVSKISGYGNVNVYGHVDTIDMSGTSTVNIYATGTCGSVTGDDQLNIWGTVDKVFGKGGYVYIYKDAVVNTIDPESAECHLYPGAKVDTIDSSYSYSTVYFEYVNSTENTHDVNTVHCVSGGYFYLANGTIVNIHKWWNTSSSSSTYIKPKDTGGDNTVFNFMANALIYWNYVYITDNVVVTNWGQHWVTGGSGYGFYLQDNAVYHNQGSLYPEGEIYIDILAVFYNWALIQSTNSDPTTFDYSCYFYGNSQFQTSDYAYPMMYNKQTGHIDCYHVYFNDINVECDGNITSEYMELGGYPGSSGYTYPVLTYTKIATNEQPINLKGSSGQILFDGSRYVAAITSDNYYYDITCTGNITVGWANFSNSPNIYWTMGDNIWTMFVGDVYSSGYFYYTYGTVIYGGNFYKTYYNSIYLTNNTCIFNENSKVVDTGSTDSTSFYVQTYAQLYLRGVWTYTQSYFYIYLTDPTSLAVNQGILSASNFYVDTTDSTNAGTFANVGTLTTPYVNFGSANTGFCKGGTLNLQGTSDTYWNSRIYLTGAWATEGYFELIVPDNFDTKSWDTTYNYVIDYSTTNEPQNWDATDAKGLYNTVSGIIPSIINYCKASGYVYAYVSKAPTTCDPNPVIPPVETTVCDYPLYGGIPDASKPSGGTPGTPAPGTTPGTPVTPGPVTPGTPVTPGPVTPGTPVTPGPVTPGTPVTPGPVTPGTPVTPGPVTPGTPAPTPVSPSSTGILSYSLVVSLFIFYLFRMF